MGRFTLDQTDTVAGLDQLAVDALEQLAVDAVAGLADDALDVLDCIGSLDHLSNGNDTRRGATVWPSMPSTSSTGWICWPRVSLAVINALHLSNGLINGAYTRKPHKYLLFARPFGPIYQFITFITWGDKC